MSKLQNVLRSLSESLKRLRASDQAKRAARASDPTRIAKREARKAAFQAWQTKVRQRFLKWREERREKKMNEKPGPIDKSFGGRLLIVSGILYTLTAIVAIFTPALDLKVTAIDPGWIAFWFTALYLIISWRWYDPIKAEQLVVLERLGRPIAILEAGPPLVPPGIYKLRPFKKPVVQKEFPAEPRFIYDGEMKDRTELPPGMVPPIRINFGDTIKNDQEAIEIFGDDYEVSEFSRINLAVLHRKHPDIVKYTNWSEYSSAELEEIEQLPDDDVPKVTFRTPVPQDGLARRVTEAVTPVVRWRVEDAIAFITKIGGDPEEVNRQIEDEMVSVLQRHLPRMSLAQALANMTWVNAHLFDSVVRRTLGWGITIEGAYLKQITTHHSLNTAISAASQAEFQGRADRELATQRGLGAAAAARALEEETLKGRADGQAAMIDKLDLKGDQILAAEVVREIAKGGNAVIVGADGPAQLMGLITSATRQAQKSPSDQT